MIMDILLFSLIILHFLYREYLLLKYKSSKSRSKWKIFDSIVFFVIPLLQLYSPNIGRLDFLTNPTLKIIGLILFILGFIYSIWGKYTLSTLWVTGWEYKINDNHRIIVQGPYKYFTHPIYIGLILMCIGLELYLANILLFICLFIITPLFHIQAKKEEKLLIEHFGEEYIRFKNSRLIL